MEQLSALMDYKTWMNLSLKIKMVLFIMHNLLFIVYHLKLLTLVYTTAVMQWFTEFMELFLSYWELNNFWSLIWCKCVLSFNTLPHYVIFVAVSLAC